MIYIGVVFIFNYWFILIVIGVIVLVMSIIGVIVLVMSKGSCLGLCLYYVVIRVVFLLF